jgi:hypothetical protein
METRHRVALEALAKTMQRYHITLSVDENTQRVEISVAGYVAFSWDIIDGDFVTEHHITYRK